MDLSKLARFTFGAGLIGLLVLPSTEVDGGISATCGGCMALSLCSTFSPARPAHAETCALPKLTG